MFASIADIVFNELMTHTYVFGSDHNKVEVFILNSNGARYHGYAPEMRTTHSAESIDELLSLFRNDIEESRIWMQYSQSC